MADTIYRAGDQAKTRGGDVVLLGKYAGDGDETLMYGLGRRLVHVFDDGRSSLGENYDLVELLHRAVIPMPPVGVVAAEADTVITATGPALNPGVAGWHAILTVVDGYKPLAEVLAAALDQAQAGKGKERHANDKPFDRQPIMEIGRMVGLGYQTGQAMKKLQEAVGMTARGQVEAAEREMLGAINYAAAAILLIRERGFGCAARTDPPKPEAPSC